MIANIFKRVTTVALATAGSVAAFGFATTSPAQAQVACPAGPFTLTAFKLIGPSGCYVTDKKFVFIGSDPTIGTGAIGDGNVQIDTPFPILHSFNYSPVPALTSAGGTFTIDYEISIFDDPATPVDETSHQFFHEFSVGYDATGMGDLGITVTKTVWLDAIGGLQLVGTSEAKSTDINGAGSPGNIVTVSGHVQKLFVRDVFGTTNTTMGFINSVTNDFTQKTKKTPEPSAILGILAVAGAGAFARRKG